MLKRNSNITTIIFAAVLSIMTVLGIACAVLSTNQMIDEFVKEHFIFFASSIILLALFFYIVVKTLLKIIDKFNTRAVDKPQDNNRLVLPKLLMVKTTVVLIAFWTPYLIMMFPGTFGGLDYFWQLMQGCGALPLSNHHPVLSSFVFAALYKAGYFFGGAYGGVFFTSLVQLLFMTSVLGFCLSILYELGVCKRVYWIMLAILAVCPVFPAHAIWLIKDSIFSSIAVLFFFCSFLFYWGKRNEIKIPSIASLPSIVCMAFIISIYRNGTIVVAALQIIVLIYVCYINECKLNIKHKTSLRLVASLCALVVLVLSWGSILDAKGVYPTNFRESVGIPSRQIIRSLEKNPESFNNKEMKTLEHAHRYALLHGRDMDKIIEDNNYISADNIKPSPFENKQDIKDYIKLWATIGLKNPGIYIDEGLKSTCAYWWPGYDAKLVVIAVPTLSARDFFIDYDVKNKPLRNYFGPIPLSVGNNDTILDQTCYEYLQSYPMLYDLLSVHCYNESARQAIQDSIEKIKQIPVLSLPLCPGTYTWLMLFCLFYLFIRGKEGACIWPVLLVIIMACLSPINGYMRYVLSTDLLSILLVGMCFVPTKKNMIQDIIND